MPNIEGHRSGERRRFSPAAERNQGPILAVLQRTLPRTGLVLEVGSGTGQHVAYFARALPQLTWQPSDADASHHDSIRAWVGGDSAPNVREPVELDVCRRPWPVAHADAVLSINMVHVAPWAAAQALILGAAEVLGPGGLLFLYGPYRRFGRHTSPGNEAFDAQLRATDAAWGLRDVEVVVERAAEAGFSLEEIVDMPANNFSVVLRGEPRVHARCEEAD